MAIMSMTAMRQSDVSRKHTFGRCDLFEDRFDKSKEATTLTLLSHYKAIPYALQNAIDWRNCFIRQLIINKLNLDVSKV